MARRKLTVAESLRIIKLFYELLEVADGNLTWTFFASQQAAFTAFCELYQIEELQPTAPPYLKSLEFLDIFLTTVISYLSNGNLHTPTDTWILDPAEGNKQAEKDLLINALACEQSAVSALKEFAKIMQKTSRFMRDKVTLGASMVEQFNKFTELQDTLDNLVNRVVRSTISKDDALNKVEKVLDAIQALGATMKNFYTCEPGESEFQGLQLLFGPNPFLNGLLDDDIDACMREASDNDPLVSLRVNENVNGREDVPLLQQGYTAAMQLFTAIKNIRNEEEELSKQVTRLRVNLNKDIQEIAPDIYNDEPTEDSPSVIGDMVRQVEELKKRMTAINCMTDAVVVYQRVTIVTRTEDLDLSAEEFFKKARRKLLGLKDKIQDQKKAQQDRDKTILQETLKSLPKGRLCTLRSRRDVVPWVNRFQEIKESLKKSNAPEWRSQLLQMAKESLKLETDINATRYMSTLWEFEGYMNTTYVLEANLVDDLLSELIRKEVPTTAAQSIANIQEGLVIMKTIRRKKLTPKFTERHFEMLIRVTLSKQDRNEFRREHAKEKVENRLAASSTLLDVEEDEEEEIDWNKTLAEEIEVTSLDSRREFLMKFWDRKLIQLKDMQTAERVLGTEKESRNVNKLKKVHFGDKAFIMKEWSEGECSREELSDMEEIPSSVFLAGERRKNDRVKGKNDKKYNKKSCPIRCSKEIHSNGSLFFCDSFRQKSKDERRALQKKTHVCISCLSKAGPDHKCPVGPCASCGSAHNILLCPKESEKGENVRILRQGENSDSDSDGFTEDDAHYNANNNDQVFMVRRERPRTSTPKSAGKSKSEEKGENLSDKLKIKARETKTVSIQGEGVEREAAESITPKEVTEKNKEEEQEKLKGVKHFLEELVKNMPKNKNPTISCAMEVIKATDNTQFNDRVCFLQSGQTREGSNYLHEGSSRYATEEEVETDGEVGDDEASNSDSSNAEGELQSSYEEAELLFEVDKVIMEPNTETERSGVEEPEDECIPNLCYSSESCSSSEEEDDNEEIDDGIFLATSVTNLRRREVFGIETSFEERRKALNNNKEKKKNKQEAPSESKKISLEDAQEILKETLEADERNIKSRNPKKNVFSQQKWENTGRWEQILQEGAVRHENYEEQVRMLYTPDTEPAGNIETELPAGMVRVTYGPKEGGVMFRELINTATRAFQKLESAGRNMSSMITPITVMGSIKSADMDLARSLNLNTKEIGEDFVVETSGVVDTGADVAVGDKTIRKVLGREPLPDAKSGLQGCTGTDENRAQDKIRIVTKDKQVTIASVRTVETLGVGAPDTAEFQEAVKSELGLKGELLNKFHFAKDATEPRVIIGLKNGDLLGAMVDEKDMLEMGMDVPTFSPNLKIWTTSLNEKFLVTGSIGCDPKLIERENNFPRFTVIKRKNDTEEELLKYVKRKGKELLQRIDDEITNKLQTPDNTANGQSACFVTKVTKVDNESEKGSFESPVESNSLASQEAKPEEANNKSSHLETVRHNISGGPTNTLSMQREPTDCNKESKNQNCVSCGIDEWVNKYDNLNWAEEQDRILIKDNNEVLLYSSYGNSDSWIYNKIIYRTKATDKVFYSKGDSMKLEKFLAAESSIKDTIKRKCLLHSARCETCEILSRQNHRREGNLISLIWENITAKPVGGDKFQISHKYSYRHDPRLTYSPSRSNVRDAAGHSRKVIRKAHHNGSLDLLEAQVNKMILKKSFVELSETEVLDLSSQPHLFCYYNYVLNSNSASTPYRMISNTSNVSSETTISVEQLSPQQILNPQESGLVRFQLFAVPLAADVKSAYHTIMVDTQSSFLRLFFWWWDLPTCSQARIFRQVTQSFGDTSAAIGLEIGIIKFVATFAVLAITKHILEHTRYADNIIHSTETFEEHLQIKKDLEKSFSKYSMDLKYVITSQDYDPNVLENQARGSQVEERLLGLNWDLRSDTILAKPRYNLFGTARGAILGPNLEDMDIQEIMKAPLSRLTFLRLTAQSYNKMQNLLGPLITSIKALASRSCELASVKEMEMDLSSRDPDFIAWARKFIINLRSVDKIIPFRRAWVPANHKLAGFITSLDGGKLGFGCSIHSLAIPPDSQENLDRALCSCKSKISKRNIPAHEALAGKLGADALHQILQPLCFDFSLEKLKFFFFMDSTCTLAMLNPQLDLKNMLLANAVSAFKEKLIEISIQFPNSVSMIGFIPGTMNPADGMTKLYADPINIINSSLYRHGPQKFENFKSLENELVAKVENGEFTYLGLPARFNPASPTSHEEPTDKCMFCNQTEMCGLVLTRNRARREAEESELEQGDLVTEQIKSKQCGSEQEEVLQNWLKKINNHLQWTGPESLIDKNYVVKCDLVIDRPSYLSILGKMFRLEQVLRTFAYLAAIHRARTIPHIQDFDIKKEAFYLLLRTSQAHFCSDLGKVGDVQVNGITCMSLRLQMQHARAIFGGNILPVIASCDPLTVKFIRYKHIHGESIGRGMHFNAKTTAQNLVRGEVGVTWKMKATSVRKYLHECGTCNKFRNCKLRPLLGNSLVRVNASLAPWRNVSIDPLGHVRVSTKGAHTMKVYPMIMADINTGAICFEILNQLEAKDVFLALSRVEFRFNTRIVQILSDKGSQLKHHLLGEKKEYYQNKLAEMWGVFNNQAFSQHRNFCERKVQDAKKLIRQVLNGLPGPIKEPSALSFLETVLCMAANSVNTCPYMEGLNTHLLCPADLLSPWNAKEIQIRHIPSSGLKGLEFVRRALLLKKEQMQDLQRKEMAEELRFKRGRMKLGANKTAPTVGVGSVVMIERNPGGGPELGVLTHIDKGTCTVELKSSSVQTTLAVLTPITAMDQERSIMPEISHYLSVEVKGDEAMRKLNEMQVQMEEIPGMGKVTKTKALHLTLGVLKVPLGDLEEVMEKTKRAVESFRDLMESDSGFLITLGEIQYLDHGALALGVVLGKELCMMLRHLVETELMPWIADIRFCPHVTIFTNNSMSEEGRKQLRESLKPTKIGSLSCERVTLRTKKTDAVKSITLLECSLRVEEEGVDM